LGQWIAGSLHALAFGGSFGWRRVHDDTPAQDSVRAVYVVWRSFEHSLLGRVSVFGRTYLYSSVVSYYIFFTMVDYVPTDFLMIVILNMNQYD
jgi:hypothetical protein